MIWRYFWTQIFFYNNYVSVHVDKGYQRLEGAKPPQS